VVGALNSFIQNIRKDEFLKVTDATGKVEQVGVVDGQNVQDVALGAAENLMTGEPRSDRDLCHRRAADGRLGRRRESQGRQDRTSRSIGWDLTAKA
jgi:ribose transport system substrate-binding protein